MFSKKKMIKLYNTLSRKKEVFKPLKDKKVRLYTCGPTVYWYAHIGNLRTFIFEDILKRVLEYNGYRVKHLMNITDVGHLTSDEDSGEDKIELRAKQEKKSAWQIADFYTKTFKKDLKALNIIPPTLWAKATDYIKEQIEFIKILERKGFTYKIDDGVYFDTSKLKTYGRLQGKKLKIKAGARVKLVAGKKNPADFALWKFTPPGVKRQMEWDSPFGRGFPGWHTECVVISKKFLGIPFDIHCGGIDHILIHHTNEIAQAEAAFGKILANFWLHGEFLTIQGGRMGKSEGNIIILEELIKKKINPLAYRYLCLTTHYKSKLNFSWKSLDAAKNALDNLYERIQGIKISKQTKEKSKIALRYLNRFFDFINDDLNMPKALAVLWEVVKSPELKKQEKYNLIVEFDKVFGLNLTKIKKTVIPSEIKELIEKREKYREEKKWEEADKIREKIKKMGYLLEDTRSGPKVKKI